jgi:hypothetical protein
VISASENSNKFQKPSFWKENSKKKKTNLQKKSNISLQGGRGELRNALTFWW